jgi:hypothetical protein
MHACGYDKDSPMFCINGIVMTVVFFFARISIIPIFWYNVYSIYKSELWIENINFISSMSFICVLLDIINIFWFSKLLKGASLILSKFNKTHIN